MVGDQPSSQGYTGHHLDSPRIKVERAVEHLEALEGEWKAFVADGQPYGVEVEFNRELGYHVAVLSRDREPPARLGTVFGDFVHNLRSALDHVAWQAACRCNPVDKLMKWRTRKKISFPITQSEEKFAAHTLMPFICEDAKAVFRAAQPYDTPNVTKDERLRHPLACLDRLWNTDKHRLLHAAVAGIELNTIRYVPTGFDAAAFDSMTVELLIKRGDTLDVGTKIAKITFPGHPEPHRIKVHVNGHPRTEPVFRDGRFVLSDLDWRDMCIAVRSVIESAASLFSSTAH